MAFSFRQAFEEYQRRGRVEIKTDGAHNISFHFAQVRSNPHVFSYDFAAETVTTGEGRGGETLPFESVSPEEVDVAREQWALRRGNPSVSS